MRTDKVHQRPSGAARRAELLARGRDAAATALVAGDIAAEHAALRGIAPRCDQAAAEAHEARRARAEVAGVEVEAREIFGRDIIGPTAEQQAKRDFELAEIVTWDAGRMHRARAVRAAHSDPIARLSRYVALEPAQRQAAERYLHDTEMGGRLLGGVGRYDDDAFGSSDDLVERKVDAQARLIRARYTLGQLAEELPGIVQAVLVEGMSCAEAAIAWRDCKPGAFSRATQSVLGALIGGAA